ncbi:Vomeronasal type-2 receptor 26, partial [Varanus komodoensis]
MVSNEAYQYMGIVRLLKHFGWMWIGLFAADDTSGDYFLEVLEPLLSQNKICSAFTQRVPHQQRPENNWDAIISLTSEFHLLVTQTKANVFVLYGNTFTYLTLRFFMPSEDPKDLGKVWIMTAQIEFALIDSESDSELETYQGALSFMVHTNELPEFKKFLHLVTPDWTQGDGFIQDFWKCAFKCTFPNPRLLRKFGRTCTGLEKLENLPASLFEMDMTGHSYAVYNAVYAVAHSLHAIHSSRSKHRGMKGPNRLSLQDLQPWKIHTYIQGISFNNSAGEEISFNDEREMRGGFDIANMVIFPNNSFQRVKVGRVDSDALEGTRFIFHDESLVWHQDFKQGVPISTCTDSCQIGYQKKKKEGLKFCCYDCVPCLEGKVSNQKDAKECLLSATFSVPHEWYQPGDLLFGAMVSQITYAFDEVLFNKHPSQNLFQIPSAVTKLYQHVLALAFAVKEINEDSKILPNVTFGFHISDSYSDLRMTYRTTLDLLFKSLQFVPNYKCDTQKNLIAVIGGLSPETSSHMADIVGFYKIPQ